MKWEIVEDPNEGRATSPGREYVKDENTFDGEMASRVEINYLVMESEGEDMSHPTVFEANVKKHVTFDLAGTEEHWETNNNGIMFGVVVEDEVKPNVVIKSELHDYEAESTGMDRINTNIENIRNYGMSQSKLMKTHGYGCESKRNHPQEEDLPLPEKDFS